MPSTSLVTTLSLLTCFGVAVSATSSDSPSSGPSQYQLERSVDDGSSWTPRGSIVVTGATASAAKARFTETAEAIAENNNGISDESRKLILNADRILYRVRDATAAKTDGGEIARIITTPCSLVRGFNLKTTKEAELIESLNVVVTKTSDNQNKVTGLQFVPRTNLHHSGSSKYGPNGDLCDKEVLSLFPKLAVTTIVGVSRPTVPKRTPKYDESLYAGGGGATTEELEQQKAKANVKLNEEGKPVDAEGKVIPEPDNRSFFEKYWHYIVMFLLWNVLQNFINPQKKAEEGKGGEAGAATAAAAVAAKK